MSKTTESNSPLPRRLREARVKARISQKSLGILAGVDEFSASARINHYEVGRHLPDYDTARRLSEVLRVPTSYLYEENDSVARMILIFDQLNDSERKKAIEMIEAFQDETYRLSGES